jgi:hypothetical protein
LFPILKPISATDATAARYLRLEAVITAGQI